MFYQFQGVQDVQESDTSPQYKGDKSQGAKPTKGLHACVECQRRKIRCDGSQPCHPCRSRRSQKRCVYDQHRQRLLPSRKMLEDLSQNLEECRTVLRRLYPNHEVKALVPLSSRQLFDLLERPAENTVDSMPSPSLSSPENPLPLEQMPTENSEWDEERRDRDPIPAEADDINALSLTIDKQASYLGASSIKAALMAMLKVQPKLRAALASPPRGEGEKTSAGAVLRYSIKSSRESFPIPWTWKGQIYVDAYFKRIHILTPMLDEVSFRADYLNGQRNDAPWLSLLNTVFAMGTVAATKSSDLNHIKYYHQAMEYLPLSSFGSSHIETVQALALLGGFYLHYINRPNMANAILGAAIRMASALGLHRESLAQTSNDVTAAETRRRTWWSLFCLDTWATTTMGRPSFGRWGPAINIQPPNLSKAKGEYDSAQRSGIMPLLENIKFCKIATRIQDMLAVSPLLKREDRSHLDESLVDWHSNLPWHLHGAGTCAESLNLSRCFMNWRCWNLRILLYRPTLLTLASNSKSLPMAEEDATSIATCQELAKKTIEDISNEWMRHQMSGWNAVWFLYQAVMIPLVSILWQPKSACMADWKTQIETALGLFDSMEDWSLTAGRSRDVVRRIYEASCQFSAQDNSPSQGGETGQDQAEEEIHISPIGLEMDDVVSMLDQDWLWDVDGLVWEQQTSLSVEEDMFGFESDMMPLDQLSLGMDGPYHGSQNTG
ncbi:fungal-specific transcription factor domain-containing protein [Dactylonectria estremocensis]|uniref:Fungal-specific transcription factor domain-containing protein n=1 Tax=Dactylonectria estremocensis TaxID=1079267 RepID=A0A9P9ET59_9HYPO|nr:fungal-specific transcription factor domain-containing protein [Dactylonectria estremocensis]